MSLVSRLKILKFIIPRVSAPLLPSTRLPSLSNTSRTPRTIRLFTHFPARLLSPPSSTEPPRNTVPPDASLSNRLKHLLKSYGWYALGVYAVLSALDFSIAFLGVNLLGAEYVAEVAASVRSTVASIIYTRPAEPGRDELESIGKSPASKDGHEGLYAMLVLAYTIHKTLFVPVRVGLTAALTPRLVGWLSRKGWTGSAGTRRAANEMRERIQQRRKRDDNVTPKSP